MWVCLLCAVVGGERSGGAACGWESGCVEEPCVGSKPEWFGGWRRGRFGERVFGIGGSRNVLGPFEELWLFVVDMRWLYAPDARYYARFLALQGHSAYGARRQRC